MKSPLLIPGLAGFALLGLGAAVLGRLSFVRQRMPLLAQDDQPAKRLTASAPRAKPTAAKRRPAVRRKTAGSAASK